ncbi:hypothetical protein BX616_003668, partial [Lobosporangium transversale]
SLSTSTLSRPVMDGLIPTADHHPSCHETDSSKGKKMDSKDDALHQKPTTAGALPNPSSARVFSNQKRKRESTEKSSSSSLHKPFRSPVRLMANDLTSTCRIVSSRHNLHADTVSTTKVCDLHDETFINSIKTNTPELLATTPTEEPSIVRTTKPILRQRVGVGMQKAFRSPVISRQNQASNLKRAKNTVNSQVTQIQALQTKMKELESSIRKARQVLHLQEANDAPLQELIDRWRKVSIEGAQVLLEKYLAQEQFFGGGSGESQSLWDQDSTPVASSWGRSLTNTSSSQDRQQKQKRQQGLTEMDLEQLDAMEECMEIQDVQQDLPTVEEAIRLRSVPDKHMGYGGEAALVKMTPMLKLLRSLGIDPAIIGYDVEQDTFTNDEHVHQNM